MFKTDINKENIDDLEAIYFYDKVHMRSNSENEFKVPKLNLNFALVKFSNFRKNYRKIKLMKEKKMLRCLIHQARIKTINFRFLIKSLLMLFPLRKSIK